MAFQKVPEQINWPDFQAPPDPPKLATLKGLLDTSYRNLARLVNNIVAGLVTIPVPEASGGTGTSTVMTQGSIIFAGASAYAQDNARLFWDDTNFKLKIGGDISLLHVALTLSNGNNADIAVGGASLVTVTGPTGAFNLNGFAAAAGEDGKVLIVVNDTAQTMTIKNEDTVGEATAANRIQTVSGADVAVSASAGSKCVAAFVYDQTASRWVLLMTNPPQSSGTGAADVTNRNIGWLQPDVNLNNGNVVVVGASGSTNPTGTIAILKETSGFYSNFKTSTVANNTAGYAAAGPNIYPDAGWTALIVVRTGAAADEANVRHFWGFSPNNLTLSDTPPANTIAIRWSTNVPDTNFQLLTVDNGGTVETHDSGVAPVVSTRYEFKIVYTHATSVVWYINGTNVGTSTVRFPLDGATMHLNAFVQTLNTTAKNGYFGKFYFQIPT